MNIQKVFIISLPERQDRLIPLTQYLDKIKMEYTVVVAIKHSNGKRGLIETMERLLTQCMYEGWDRVLILEDDAKFIVEKPNDLIDKCLLQLPPTYDLFYLGVNLFQDAELCMPNLIKLNSGYASHAIIYSKKGIRKVLEAILKKKLNHWALDEIIVKLVQSQGNSYCSFPLIASQASGWSDIEKKEVDYTKFIEQRFEERTAHLKKNLEV